MLDEEAAFLADHGVLPADGEPGRSVAEIGASTGAAFVSRAGVETGSSLSAETLGPERDGEPGTHPRRIRSEGHR